MHSWERKALFADNEIDNKIEKNSYNNKGGRPQKQVKRIHRLRIACSPTELIIIKAKAEQLQLTLSEFLREAALQSQIVNKQKTLPKEVLAFTGQLNHLAANINTMAYKNNRQEYFNIIERAEFKSLAMQVKELSQQIKDFIS